MGTEKMLKEQTENYEGHEIIAEQRYRIVYDSYTTTTGSLNKPQMTKEEILNDGFEDYDCFLGGISEKDFKSYASVEVIAHSGIDFAEPKAMSLEELERIKVDPYSSMTILKKVVSLKQVIHDMKAFRNAEQITKTENVYHLAYPIIGERDREVLLLIMLNPQFKVIGVHEVSVGTVGSVLSHPREIFKGAILSNASGVIIAHQHPSGNITESKQDILMTKQLVQAGNILEIPVIDHIIVGMGNKDFTSMREKGYIQN